MLVGRALIYLFIDSASSFGKQHWVTGEYKTEVLNFIPKQTENRLGTLEVLFVYAPFRYINALLTEHNVYGLQVNLAWYHGPTLVLHFNLLCFVVPCCRAMFNHFNYFK